MKIFLLFIAAILFSACCPTNEVFVIDDPDGDENYYYIKDTVDNIDYRIAGTHVTPYSSDITGVIIYIFAENYGKDTLYIPVNKMNLYCDRYDFHVINSVYGVVPPNEEEAAALEYRGEFKLGGNWLYDKRDSTQKIMEVLFTVDGIKNIGVHKIKFYSKLRY